MERRSDLETMGKANSERRTTTVGLAEKTRGPHWDRTPGGSWKPSRPPLLLRSGMALDEFQ
jgi:hypothetical protein